MKLISGLLILFVNLVFAQDYQDYEQPQRAAPVRLRPGNGPVEAKPTPVAILKQINRHNEDGSYTYGYEGGDGSFKIETKLATGEVKGKYGYVDTTGKVRVVEYGANKYGFQPSGEGITVAPPTLVDETTNKDGIQLDYEEQQQQQDQQQQYQQQPQKPFIARVSRPQPQPQQRPAPRPQSRPQYSDYDQEQEQPQQRQQYSPGPAPPRLQIPGAQPNDVVYAPQSRPARPESEYSQIQSFGAGPQHQQQQQQQQQQHQHQHPNVRISRPQYAPAPSGRTETFAAPVRPVQEPNYQPQQQSRPQYAPHAQQSAPQGRSTSVLDQLAKDYALPQNGANALHDISFGYF